MSSSPIDNNDNKEKSIKTTKPIELRRKTRYEGIVDSVEFGGKGVVNFEGRRIMLDHVIPGQKVSFCICKIRKGKCPGGSVEVIEKSPFEDVEDICKHNKECGGCLYQSMGYQHQLEMKKTQVLQMINKEIKDYQFDGIKASPINIGYRNRMDYTFGDGYIGGPLECGLHKMYHFNDVVTTIDCRIVDKDFNELLLFTRDYFRIKNIPHYNKIKHTGYLRNLLIRKAKKTNEIMYCLITSSQLNVDLNELKNKLLELPLMGKLVSIIHCIFDDITDIVGYDKMNVLYGNDYITEELLGLHFKITPMSFFQTNSLGAEVLYQTVRDYITTIRCDIIFDLYCGTGTITQLLSPICKKIIGVELNQDAIRAAKLNAELNKLTNCEFRAADVNIELDQLQENRPELIVLDPPRTGIHPTALSKIIKYGAQTIVYVSCMPTTLIRDLIVLEQNGYKVKNITLVDMFPNTPHVETVCLLKKINSPN
ncbi:RNA methyltransferase putative [Entamoeba histolytica]|uniref:RNA methyltransferase putative n=1 Tax=Entamoeba histolytica TaxID=5759 RepID=A0A175JV56_ENTHI|nr:RNA methyltransferase putative [Entamoeba histolytica]